MKIPRSCILYLLCLYFSTIKICMAQVALTDTLKKELDLEVQNYVQALDQSDAKLLMSNIHPQVFSQLGITKVDLLEKLNIEFAKRGKSNIHYQTEYYLPEHYYQCKDDIIVIIEIQSIVQMNGSSLLGLSFLLYTKKLNSSEWFYVEGLVVDSSNFLTEVFNCGEQNIDYPSPTMEIKY